MAEHGAADMQAHTSTYAGFIKGSIALTIISLFILVSLVSFGFGHSMSVLLGFLGLILGLIAVAIDARAGSRWFLSIGLLVVFGLITAINVS